MIDHRGQSHDVLIYIRYSLAPCRLTREKEIRRLDNGFARRALCFLFSGTVIGPPHLCYH